LAAVFPPLRLAADGVHRLTVQLHPADLGPVSVLAEIRGGEIHVHLAAVSEAGREALRTALPELRRDLQAAGFSTGTLDLQQDGPGQGQPRHQQAGGPAPEQPTQPAPRPRPAPAAVPLAAQPAGANRQLDLHL
jgi:flagellar hook-length control protein FliK